MQFLSLTEKKIVFFSSFLNWSVFSEICSLFSNRGISNNKEIVYVSDIGVEFNVWYTFRIIYLPNEMKVYVNDNLVHTASKSPHISYQNKPVYIANPWNYGIENNINNI